MILRKGTVAPVLNTNNYPAAFTDLGVSHHTPLSDAGGLTQFGAFTETLQPGAVSSQRHWHTAEDEFLYVLAGTVTVVEDDGTHALSPGDSACWPAGTANAHHLRNDGTDPVTYLIVGTRSADDTCTYPDIDLHYTRAAGLRTFAQKDGTPYPGWPKETTR
jgi:uncharacterized cupin superfamily protein